MLARWVVTIWVAWLGTFGLAAYLYARQVWNPDPIPAIGLPALMLAAGLGLVASASFRLVRGPRRDRALAGLLLGLPPFWFLLGHVLMAIRPGFDRKVPPGWPSKVLSPLARPFLDLAARRYPQERTRGRWVERIGTPGREARNEVAAMDRHVDALLARLHQRATWPIAWYRGAPFGLGGHAIYDMALGSEVGQFATGADGLTGLDRHEVAHAVMTRNHDGRSDPPSILSEGWAEANMGKTEAEVARIARDERKAGRDLTLRQLVAPDWYWHHATAAYSHGAPLVNYLLRVHGPERFIRLYASCQQATFEADTRAILGVGLDDLDAAYWADVEQIVAREGPAARGWLKALKLDPGVDPAGWDAFLADYFAAAARVVPDYEHVRMTTSFHAGQGADGSPPWYYQQRLTLLRSGPSSLLRRQSSDDESATLAHPDRSVGIERTIRPDRGPWTMQGDPAATPEQRYRRASSRIQWLVDSHAFLALHGGMALLEYPQVFRDYGLAPDLEVARLSRSTVDGHRATTLELRSPPAVKPADRQAYTFRLLDDDSFAARSIHCEFLGNVSDADCTYDHPAGRPVLRSLVARIGRPPDPQIRTCRLDVEECRFGLIPESEFTIDPFLATLKPAEVVTRSPDPPSNAHLLDGYWLAFVAGFVSLAGGIGLMMAARRRDRRASGGDQVSIPSRIPTGRDGPRKPDAGSSLSG